MRGLLAVAALVALGGCEKASTKAVREAEMVDATQDKPALCEAQKKVTAAFLAEGDEAKYREAKTQSDTTCNYVDAFRAAGLKP